MKLEDIKKKNIYSVPDKYFDQLPTRIQSRVNEKHPVSGWSWNWNLAYKLALPVLAVIILVFYIGRQDTQMPQDAEALLAEVSTDDIIAYLENTDITTEEIIEAIDFSDAELDFYENDPMIDQFEEFGEEEIDILIDKYRLDQEIL